MGVPGDEISSKSSGEDTQWKKMADEVLQQREEKAISTFNESFEAVRGNHQSNYDAKVETLKTLKEQLENTKENDTRKIEFLTRRINNLTDTINRLGSGLKYMRPNNEEDLKKRRDIREGFSEAVAEVIPDGEPMVFHGTNNIGVVEAIIQSGGLKTPDDRDVDFRSFASLIDVAAKSNIQTACNFADTSALSFLPYGAIFAFYPKPHEIEKVLSTGTSTEVSGGVDGVDLDEDRFVGIITTDENIEKIKELFKINNLDVGKIFTHEEFLEHCKKVFANN